MSDIGASEQVQANNLSRVALKLGILQHISSVGEIIIYILCESMIEMC